MPAEVSVSIDDNEFESLHVSDEAIAIEMEDELFSVPLTPTSTASI